MNDPHSTEMTKAIAARVLSGQMDLFVGCIEVVRFRPSLPRVPDEVWDVFSAVACEIDGLPVGAEREYWDREALKSKDRELEDYRRRIQSIVLQAFEELRASLK